jgi:fermentation-respiration switch protein FrsA (DUF1100 family)
MKLVGATIGFLVAALLQADTPTSDRDLRESIVSSGAQRTYRVFVPGGFGRSGPAPAIVLFNGSGSNVDPLMDQIESEYFAAAGAHAGALRSGDAPLLDAATRKIPLAIWIGTKDQLVPLQMARDTRDVLRERGFPIALTELKGHTHSYAERGEDVTAQAWQFLKKASLPSDPRYVKYQFNRP